MIERVVWNRNVAKRLKKRVPAMMRHRIEKAVLKLAETEQGDVMPVVGSDGDLRQAYKALMHYAVAGFGWNPLSVEVTERGS